MAHTHSLGDIVAYDVFITRLGDQSADIPVGYFDGAGQYAAALECARAHRRPGVTYARVLNRYSCGCRES